MTLAIPKRTLGTLLWKLLNQHIGRFQKRLDPNPPLYSILNVKGLLQMYVCIFKYCIIIFLVCFKFSLIQISYFSVLALNDFTNLIRDNFIMRRIQKILTNFILKLSHWIKWWKFDENAKEIIKSIIQVKLQCFNHN